MNFIITKLSWFISIVFHPLLYASLGAWIILMNSPEYSNFNKDFSFKFTQIIFILTYIIPLIGVPIYKLIILLTKSTKNELRERRFLLFSTTIIYIFTYRIIESLESYHLISIFMLLCCIIMIISAITTYFYKISLHMIGIGGFIGFLLFISFQSNPFDFYILPLAFLIAGLIGSSRLYLQAHNQFQIYSGFVLGISTAILFFYFMY